jgi:adenosine deaminase
VIPKFPFAEWTQAFAEAIDHAQQHLSIQAGYLLDISRRSGPQVATQIVQQAVEHKPKHLAGISMGGDEVKFPCRNYTKAFALAREHGIPSTVHVSEFNPGETTIEAIDHLQPNRLGHALNTIHSPVAYQKLKASGIPVESCPLCNFVGGMGGISKLADHPIRKYFLDGIPLSINTDDPRIFGFDLVDNYVCLMKEAGFTMDDFVKINEQAKASAFKKIWL